MNIVFMSCRAFNPSTGGIERVTDLLCREFVRRGHNVAYLNNLCGSNDDYDYPAPTYLFPDDRTQDNRAETQRNIDYYNLFCAEHGIDIVINQDPLFYERLISEARIPQGTKTIAVLHSNPLYYHYNIYSAIIARSNTWQSLKRLPWELKWARDKRIAACRKYASAYGNIIAHSDAFCMLSMNYLPELRKVYKGDTGKVTAIANPNTYEVQTSIDLGRKKKQLIYVGRLDPWQKRIDRLIDIWARIYKDFPDWELIIVGEGPQLDQLRQMAAPLERVIFAGRQNPEPFYREASILCLTSDYEGWGMVLPEAMTHGTVPILFNSYLAAPEVVGDHVSGILVKPFSMRQYERKLRRLMSNDKMRKQMALNAIKHVKQFDIANIANRWEALFDKLHGQRRR